MTQETTAMAGCRYRHKKRGTEYSVLGIGQMQTERWVDMFEGGVTPVDMEEVAVYRGDDGQLWVRPREEFEDGRFERVAAAPPSSAVEALEIARKLIRECKSDTGGYVTDNLDAAENWLDTVEAALQAGTGVAVKANHKVEHEEQPGFTYYECPECGFDCIHPADYEPRSTACPLCAGDSGHDVGMRSRPARSTDKPEGKDARPAAPVQQAGVESELVERLISAANEERDHAVEQDYWHEDLLREAAASLSQLQQRIAEVEAERDEVIRTSAAYNATEREAKAIMEEAAAIERAEAAEAALAASGAKLAEAVEKMERADEGLANAYSATYNDYDKDRLASERIGLQKGIAILRSFTSSIQDRRHD